MTTLKLCNVALVLSCGGDDEGRGEPFRGLLMSRAGGDVVDEYDMREM